MKIATPSWGGDFCMVVWMVGVWGLADEVHGVPWFGGWATWGWGGVGGFEVPCHVASEGAHGLQAFGVECGFAFGATIDDVPVLRCDDGHVHHLKWHVEALEGGCCASTTAYGNGCGGFACDAGSVGVEGALYDGEQGSVGLSVIDW